MTDLARLRALKQEESPMQSMSTLVVRLTAAVREADTIFQRVGGSSRHWVRDCFVPMLAKHHLAVADVEAVMRCEHCGVDIRAVEWLDRETHLTCAKGSNKGKPHTPFVSLPPEEDDASN